MERRLLADGDISWHGRADLFALLEPLSKANPSRDFVYELRDIGWKRADEWVSKHLKDVGEKSSLDVSKEVALRLQSSS